MSHHLEIPPSRIAQVTPDVHLSYFDSWADHDPKRERPERYTTLVALHGVGFNGAVFSPLIPYLPETIRLVAYNQRSYAGSSPAFASKTPGAVDATAAYLIDLVAFLKWTTDELDVPKKGPDGQGGIVLLGWSKGTVIPISLLALLRHLSNNSTAPKEPDGQPSFLARVAPSSPLLASLPFNLSDEVSSLKSNHLRSIILFEPPGSAFARAPTPDFLESRFSKLAKPAKRRGAPASSGGEDAGSEMADPQEEEEERKRQEWANEFASWVAGYGPPSHRQSGASTTPSPRPDDASVDASCSDDGEALVPSTLDDLDPRLVERGWEPACVLHGFEWTLSPSAAEVARLGRIAMTGGEGRVELERARLAEAGPTRGSIKVEVEVPIGVLVGGRTVGYFAETADMIREWWDPSQSEAPGVGNGDEAVRKRVVVREVSGTNHFGFVHKPELFSNVLVETIDELRGG
ncbi:hypothetical protein JCM10212_002044 [Sporobolomyces blumeae]